MNPLHLPVADGDLVGPVGRVREALGPAWVAGDFGQGAFGRGNLEVRVWEWSRVWVRVGYGDGDGEEKEEERCHGWDVHCCNVWVCVRVCVCV